MVLKITVKTLDSQNYQFEANEDWTVAQFKEHIQDTVNVLANEQRLIFCGRVLQNDLKLTEYDCNGKVIHLVRRPPPTQADEESNRRTTNETQNDRFRVIPHLEGTFTITATTIDTSLSSNRPQATATIFLTQADPNQPGIRIPVTIPLAVNPQQPPVIRTQTTDSTPATTTNSGPNILGRGTAAPLGQDPLMNMIPELAINAASHILSGVLGFPINATGATQQQQQQQQPQQQQGPRQTSSSTRSMMDIDIDDDSSPRPQSRYRETRDFRPQAFASNSPSRGATFEEQRRVSSSRAEVLLEHPDWIPIIEFDINRMANQNNSYTRFSDAYLSSIPKKRRRVLMATPDRVPVLQPSSSQAIVDILRRSVMNSNSPSNNLDHLLESLANDTEVQSAYEEFLRAVVSNRLKSDRDFCPTRYKHTNEYFATVTVEPGVNPN